MNFAMHRKNYTIKSGAHIHLMGICGVAMSSLAGMLNEKGYKITGSDQNIYPPMSTLLQNLLIPVCKGYSPHNLYPNPDLVIVGNVITKDNPEAIELMRIGLPYLSLPQALKEFAFDEKKTIVITGTHGKTTTSALIAWILEVAGLKPSFMIGGIAKNFESNFKTTSGSYFVIEGDEYDTAFFDKGPKFMHYNPFAAVITNIEFDHADIFKGIEEITDSFKRFIQIIPKEGILCINKDYVDFVDVMKVATCDTLTYSLAGKADLTIGDTTSIGEKTNFSILKRNMEYARITTNLFGNHNLSNILAATAVASSIGIDGEAIARAVATFKGVKRRLDVLGGYEDITVIDDFAHHPTAVKESIKAVKQHYHGRRIIAVFEPRSNSSRRKIFQEAYAKSFNDADLVMIPEPSMMEKIPPHDRFSSLMLVHDLQKAGIESYCFVSTKDLLNGLLAIKKTGDVVLFMSNGAFENIQEKFLYKLKTKKS
jgi:UDP-N-acetylmuramate: L-alanyl-gamma-D-glutamyl-meso-diaminopimelate ligase